MQYSKTVNIIDLEEEIKVINTATCGYLDIFVHSSQFWLNKSKKRRVSDLKALIVSDKQASAVLQTEHKLLN